MRSDKPSGGPCQHALPAGGVWTARKVAPWVQAHTGQRMAGVTAWTYPRRLGFSLQRPRHTRAASEQEQEAFKKK